MIRRHPSTDTLRNWLVAETDDDVAELTAHIDQCERCAAKLEHLAAGEEVGLDVSGIAAALSSLLAPPEGLSDRVEVKVADRLSSRQIATVVGDLFGAAFEASKLLLTEEDL